MWLKQKNIEMDTSSRYTVAELKLKFSSTGLYLIFNIIISSNIHRNREKLKISSQIKSTRLSKNKGKGFAGTGKWKRGIRKCGTSA
ncbi:uncharacterized protein LOC143235447 isoform X2 [Tachypleus tridentatus]